MDTQYETEGGNSGLSTGHLLFVFLVGVAVCAVFFSLGFLVGYNERSLKEVLVGERVTSPSVIPPTVVPVPGGVPNVPKEMASPTAGADSPPTSRVVTPGSAAPPTAETQPMTAAASAPLSPPAAGTLASGPGAPGGELGVGITLQVAASRSREDAEKMVAILKTRGYPVFVVTPEYANAKDNLYRVQVGPFRSSGEAEKVRAKLVQEGLKPFVRR
jgi:cell division septation protein DedD